MIGKLKGIVDEIGEDSLILDVGGVGYHVFVSQRLLTIMEGQGTALTLFIETQMREDAIRLYGFINRATLSGAEIADAIALRDVAILCRAPGVGKKVAERMITELKSKVGALASSNLSTSFGSDETGAGQQPTAAADAISALANLGYGRGEAVTAVAAALKQLGEGADSASLIRVGLQVMSR